MKRCEFDKLVTHRLNTCEHVLAEKGKEYSAFDGDRLEHFYKASRSRNQSPEQALMGMKVKHTICIDDLVEKVALRRPIKRRVVEEKFTDEINYLLLLEALIMENGIFTEEK